jgi:hypothetical protein
LRRTKRTECERLRKIKIPKSIPSDYKLPFQFFGNSRAIPRGWRLLLILEILPLSISVTTVVTLIESIAIKGFNAYFLNYGRVTKLFLGDIIIELSFVFS